MTDHAGNNRRIGAGDEKAGDSVESWDSFWDTDQVFEEHHRLDFDDLFPRKLQEALFSRLPKPPSGRVIEIGGGGGRFLAKFVGRGYEVAAMDISGVGLQQAHEIAVGLGRAVETVQADVFDIPPALEGCFDLVYSMAFCEHFTGDHRQQVFLQHARLVEPGGLVLIMVPNRLSLPRMFWRATRFLLTRSRSLRERYGIVWVDEDQFTARELAHRVALAGLQPILAVGSSIVEDFYWFVWGGIKKFIFRSFSTDASLRRGRFLRVRTLLDNSFGGHLFVLARRPNVQDEGSHDPQPLTRH